MKNHEYLTAETKSILHFFRPSRLILLPAVLTGLYLGTITSASANELIREEKTSEYVELPESFPDPSIGSALSFERYLQCGDPFGPSEEVTTPNNHLVEVQITREVLPLKGNMLVTQTQRLMDLGPQPGVCDNPTQ